MILRALDPKEHGDSPKFAQAQTSGAPRPIWDAIFEYQSKMSSASECWLVTQPLHAALSGDIAAKLKPEIFGAYDEATIRAIALHDAGWSEFDSKLIRASRDDERDPKQASVSFLGVSPKEAVSAWTGSVETALKASPLGGFLVSEHFRSIAQFQVDENPGKARQMAAFVQQEQMRQTKIRRRIPLDDAALERMVDGLRFCDLLSLYLCAGLTEAVEFPQQIQQLTPILRTTAADTFALKPSPFSQDEIFSFAALRHPRTKSVSSATFLCKITG